MTSIFILILMIFAHIVDDYYLQGWLATGKQKKWWIKNYPNKKYKNDYIVALFMHSFSWSFMIMLPILWYTNFNPSIWCAVLFILNIIIHSIVDDLKANKGKINLIQDQSVHIIQVIITWCALLLIY